MIRKFVIAALTIAMCISLCACDIPTNNTATQRERPHLYWKDIDVVVISVSRNQWFATVQRRSIDITVKSEEYGLTKSFTMESSGMFNTISCWDCKVGDKIKAQLYSWVLDSTGEVIKRDIHMLY